MMVHVIWQSRPSLPQFPHAVPAFLGVTSKCGKCFIVSGLGVVWVCRLKVAVRRGINSLTGKLCCGQTAERTWPPFSVPVWSANRCHVRTHRQLGSAPVIVC